MSGLGIASVRFIALRLLGLAVTLLVSSFVIFGAVYLAPGSPIAFLTHGRTTSPEAVAAINKEYGFNDPFLVQYWHWLTNALHGDFGQSINYKANVSSLLGDRAINTVQLVGFASLLILSLGIGLGVVAALRPGWVDRGIMLTSTVAMAIPAFVAAIGLIAVFAVGLGWFPVFGEGNGGFVDSVRHLVLPSAALACASLAYVARFTRATVREELASDHVQTAVSRGFTRQHVVRRHVLRNAMAPLLTVAGVTVAALIAGAVVVEQVFQLNGLGSYLIQAVGAHDFPVVQAICLIMVTTFIVLNTLIDVVYLMLDPRITAARSTS